MHAISLQFDLTSFEISQYMYLHLLENRQNEQLLILIFNVFVLNHECYLLETPKTVNHRHGTRNNRALYLPKTKYKLSKENCNLQRDTKISTEEAVIRPTSINTTREA